MMMNDHVEIKGLFEFLKNSPTAFHAVDSLCSLLQEQGFSPLQECKPWEIIPGGKYYVTRNRSSVIAFTLPEGTPASFRIVASHSDSPTFKIKENAELTVREKYVQLNTERYGGMIMSTWMDRPLSVAGRLLAVQGCEQHPHPPGEDRPRSGDDPQRGHPHEPGGQ